MRDNKKIIGIIALSELKGIGPAFVKKVVSNNSFEAANTIHEIKEITTANNKQFDDDTIYEAVERAKEIVFKCKEEGITIIELTCEDYPALLKEIKDPPSVIYCKGNLDLLYNKTVCIIGTREPNENAVKISERIGSFYSNTNWAICNGLAEGVDNFSIKLNNKIHNKIIGILAGGLNYNTKKTLLKKTAENAEKTIESGGLLISEMPPDKKEDTFTVVKSCRIQAGISKRFKHVPLRFSLTGTNLQRPNLTYNDPAKPEQSIDPITGDTVINKIGLGNKIMRHAIFGAEFNISKAIAFRLGYNYQRRQELKVDTKLGTVGISWGLGIKIYKFSIAYARSAYHLAGSPNQVTLSAKLSEFYRKK
jgi:DNA processing protein